MLISLEPVTQAVGVARVIVQQDQRPGRQSQQYTGQDRSPFWIGANFHGLGSGVGVAG